MREQSNLPVLWQDNTQQKTYSDTKIDTVDYENNYSSKSDYQYPEKRNNVGTILLSMFLSMIALLSFFLYIFSEDSGIMSNDQIISYLSSDFLGVDLTNTDKNIFELIMSESFGNADIKDKIENNDNNTDDDTIPPSTESEDENDKISSTPPPEVPQGQYAILEADLSIESVNISNKTNYEINIDDYLKKEIENEGYKLTINEDMTIDPIVLIIHTHGTEAYSAEGSNSYSETVNVPRSENIKENIVAVGSEMARVMNDMGVPTLHCQIMHDKDSYKNSYARAEQTIKKYLEKYPSIKYVLDVHRDSIINSERTKYRPVTTINGKATAQIMFVMGSDSSTPEHVNWRSNLSLAVKLTQSLNESYKKLTRTMSLRESSYNQQYTKGSLLIEVGSCGNTLNEAKNAGILIAEKLSELIKNGW